MTRSKRIYSDNEKASALAVLDANGGNISATSRQLKIPRATLTLWMQGHVHDEVTDIRREKRRELSELFRDELYAIMGLLAERRDEASYSDLTRAAGIFTDKLQLLTGQPTENQSGRIEIVITRDESPEALENTD